MKIWLRTLNSLEYAALKRGDVIVIRSYEWLSTRIANHRTYIYIRWAVVQCSAHELYLGEVRGDVTVKLLGTPKYTSRIVPRRHCFKVETGVGL